MKAIVDEITIFCYTIKYWLRGDIWKNAKYVATNIVKGWRNR